MNAGAILESVLDPLTKCLTPEAARTIVDFQPDAKTQARVDELAVLARSGTITKEQRQEYRELLDAFDLVAILQSKARSVLSGSG